jgi:hypothetical protein
MVVVATKWTGGFMALTYMCNNYGDLFSNNCNTISPRPTGFKECFWTNSWKRPLYIEESCYKSLTVEEKTIARSAAVGMVKDGIWKTFVRVEQYGNRYKFNPDAVIPYPTPDPCKGVVCEPECVGTDRYARVCKDGKCVRGALVEANSTECGYVKPKCTEGDKRPGEICRGGDWVPYTPEEPEPEEGRLYVKFDFPYLDLLPGIPYEPWMWIPPGFKIVEV